MTDTSLKVLMRNGDSGFSDKKQSKEKHSVYIALCNKLKLFLFQFHSN